MCVEIALWKSGERLGNIASIPERAEMENFGGGCDVASAVTLFSD